MAEISNSLPLHVQAANFMREKIYNHTWMPDSQIPTEFELVEMLGMSRGTVRRAIRALVDEGLLVQMRGRGTFVTQTRITHPSGNALLSFAESLRSQGIDFTTKVLRQEIVPADEYLSGKLYLSTGAPVLMLDRVRTVDGEPLIYFESAINLPALPGLDTVDFEHEALFAYIESHYNKRIGHSSARYAACVAGTERGAILGVSPEAPVLHLEQQIYLTDNTLIEWSNVWLRANKYMINMIMQRV